MEVEISSPRWIIKKPRPSALSAFLMLRDLSDWESFRHLKGTSGNLLSLYPLAA